MMAMSEAVVVFDAAGTPARANPAAVKLFGFDPAGLDSGLLARRLAVTFANGKPVKRLPSSRALRGEVVRDLELEITRPKELPRQWVLNTSPIKDERGRVRGTVAIFQEVTERKLSETVMRGVVRELERRHAEHRALLKGSRAILEQRNFKHSAGAIFRACKELTGATSGYVVLLREDRPEYDVVYMDVGDRPCTVDPSLPMPLRGLREQVYRLSKVVYENDFANSPWTKLLPPGHVTLENVLFAPLLLKGRVLGMIGLGNKPGGFTEEDARLSADFAEMATLALQNSRTHELLEQSEQRFRSVAQTAVDGIISVDRAETVVFWNAGAERIFGYSSGEMLGQPISRIIPERFAERHQVHFQETLASTQADFVRPPREVLGRHKDGREIPLELSIARWRTAADIYFTTIIRDIADRKKAETDLRRAHDELETRVQQRTAELENAVKLLEAEVCSRKQAERHSQGIASLLELFAVSTQRQDYLDSVARLLRDWARCQGAGIRLFDERGHLPFAAHAGFNREFVNSENRMRLNADPCACLRVLQHRPRLEDVPWMNVRGSFYRNQTPPGAPARPAACMQPGSPCARARYQSVAHVGIHFRDQVVGAVHLADRRPNRFDAGIIEFIEAVAPLIGEALHRFKVEGQLRESEQRFRSMFERHEAVMLLIEPASGAIVAANPAAERFYGYPRARLCAMKIDDLNDLAPAAVAAERRRAERERRNCFTFPHRIATGEIRIVEVHSSPITESGRTLLFSIIHDITDRKRLEKQILDISDQERKRVGQDLHDSLGGNLTGLALVSKSLARVLREQALPQAEIAEEIVAGINHAVAQTRSIARGLCPVELGVFGLTSGLQELAGASEKLFQVACNFSVTEKCGSAMS